MSSGGPGGLTGMTVVFAVGAGITRADIPCLCAALADQLRGRAGPGQVICDVSEAQADVVTIEALARLRLTAGRYGWRFNTQGTTDELLLLFSLMGLGGLFFSGRYARGYPPPTRGHAAATRRPPPQGAIGAAGTPAGSGGETFGEVEEGEQAGGVEEVVDAGDAAVGDLEDYQGPGDVAGAGGVGSVLGERG